MPHCQKQTITVATDASGDATVYSGSVANGRVLAILYDGGHDATADFTITTESTGQTVWTESDVTNSATFRAPRLATHATDGTASLYAAAGEPVEAYVWMADERLKIVVAQGGNATTGVFTLITG